MCLNRQDEVAYFNLPDRVTIDGHTRTHPVMAGGRVMRNLADVCHRSAE
jgi:hypothetical protein